MACGRTFGESEEARHAAGLFCFPSAWYPRYVIADCIEVAVHAVCGVEMMSGKTGHPGAIEGGPW